MNYSKKSVLVFVMFFIYEAIGLKTNLTALYFTTNGATDNIDCGNHETDVDLRFTATQDCLKSKWAPLPAKLHPASNDRLCCYHFESVCVHKRVVIQMCKTDLDFNVLVEGIYNLLKKDCSEAGFTVGDHLCYSLKTEELGAFANTCSEYVPCSPSDKPQLGLGVDNSALGHRTIDRFFSIIFWFVIIFLNRIT